MNNETRLSLMTKLIGLVIVDVGILFFITFLLSYERLTWNTFFSWLFLVSIGAFMITLFVGIGRPIKRRHDRLGYDLSSPEIKDPPVWILFSGASAIGSIVTLLLSFIIPLMFPS